VSRYKVATCSGWSISEAARTGSKPRGLTASVLDTLNCHREVKRFRSEDRLPVFPTAWRGVEGALSAAQEHADRLNAECA
jgi:predicted transcriptional regulator